MNIKDLPQGSYKTVGSDSTSSGMLNVKNLPQGSVSTPQPAKSFADTLWDSVSGAFSSGVAQVKQGASQIANPTGDSVLDGGIQGAEGALKVGSGVASMITSPLAPLFAPVNAGINAVADKVSDSPAVQKFAQTKAGDVTSRVAEDLSNAGNIAGTIAGAKAGLREAPTVAGYVDKMMEPPVKTAPITPEKSPVVDLYYKAVKPTTAGKTGTGQLESYNNDVVSAIDSIKQNKLNLAFDTDTGPVQGETPKNRAQLADSIEQTKNVLFNQYNDLTKRTTGQGVKIPLEPAGGALDDVINSEALKITNPEAINYAQNVQTRLKNEDGTYKEVDPELAQRVITSYNASLKAFYKNPTYESASRAAIDAGVVTEIRKSLGESIENATGENYSALKKQWGSLAAIERDVTKSAIAQAKQTGTNTSGLGKYVDVFAGGDMASGLLSLNPALFAKGIAQFGISHLFQFLNSPDRAVQALFKKK